MSAHTADDVFAPPEPDEALTRAYLEALFGTADAGYLPLWTSEGRQTIWLPVVDLDAAADEVAHLATSGRNVYHGLGLHPSPLGPTRRG